jgi:steroid 5-alpha reductase family enzyme
MINLFLICASFLLFYVLFWFAISIIIKRNDVADFAWGLGFVALAWLSFILSPFSWLGIISNLLITIWGLRLAFHIFQRLKNKPEDPRYANWRKTWKHFYLQSFFQVFFIQGGLLYLISVSVIFINNQAINTISYFSILGICIWILGFYFEAIADWQLKQFIRNPSNKGKIMQSGLWRYSRHPNYFGEVTMWWGIFIIAISNHGFWTIISPLTITVLILFVSGIPLLEKKYQGNLEFEKYKKTTSIFIPLPFKKL